MARVTVEDCVDKVDSPYELVLVAKERATQLNSGIEPSLERDNDKNTVIALREIAESKLTVDEMKENLIQEYQTVTLSDEEEENRELESSETNSDDNELKNSESPDINKDIEEELNDLVTAEDNEINSQYEITENADNVTSTENNEKEIITE